jgi:hypothetical protein
MYVNNEGEILLNSGNPDLPMFEHLTGTQYAAGAFNAEGNVMVVNQPDGTLKFFSVSYDEAGVPDVQYLYDYKAGAGSLVTQINYDYAGNLVVSGTKLVILSMPTDDNQTTTPAKKALIVVKNADVPYYVVGGFNSWNTNEPLEITEEGATFDVVEDPNDVESKEFKILTPGASDWIWLGGIDNNNVGYFEVTEGMMTAGTEIELYANDETTPNYANFRLPGSGNYTITLAKGAKGLYEGAKIVVKQNNTIPTAITDVSAKTVRSIQYVNVAGQMSDKPFEGVNIVVTTFTDGTKTTTKVLK